MVESAQGEGGRVGEEAWRRCVMETLWELEASAARGRAMSLPNVLRWFEMRWGREKGGEEQLARGRALGVTFLREYYLEYQPFGRGLGRAVGEVG